MYSYEIQTVLSDYGYNIPSSVYMQISSSSQVQYAKYNAWDNTFYINTTDGYEWKFSVYRD